MCGIISFVIWLLLAVFESNIIIMSIEEARIGWNKIYLGYASTQCFEIGGHGYNFLCGNIRFVIWLLLAVFESNIIIMSIEEARIGWNKIYLGYASTQCFEIGGHGYNFLCGNIRFVIWLLLAVFESNIIIMSIEEARIGWKKIYLGYASGHQRAKIHQYQDANIFKLAQNYHNFAIAQKFLYEMDLTTDV